MTIEKLIKQINHEIKCHNEELEVLLAENDKQKDKIPIEESVPIFVRGIQLRAKIDQLKTILVLCGEDVKGMPNLIDRSDNYNSVSNERKKYEGSDAQRVKAIGDRIENERLRASRV